MLRNSMLVATFLAAIASWPAVADEASKTAKIRELMDLSGTFEMIETQKIAMNQVIQSVAMQLVKKIVPKYPDVNDSLLERIRIAVEKFAESLDSEVCVSCNTNGH